MKIKLPEPIPAPRPAVIACPMELIKLPGSGDEKTDDDNKMDTAAWINFVFIFIVNCNDCKSIELL